MSLPCSITKLSLQSHSHTARFPLFKFFTAFLKLSLCIYMSRLQPSVYLRGRQKGLSQVLHHRHRWSNDHLGFQGKHTQTSTILSGGLIFLPAITPFCVCFSTSSESRSFYPGSPHHVKKILWMKEETLRPHFSLPPPRPASPPPSAPHPLRSCDAASNIT